VSETKSVYRIYATSPKNLTPKFLGMVWGNDPEDAVDVAMLTFSGWRLKGNKLKAEYAGPSDKPKD
jgi:hypothetical protein